MTPPTDRLLRASKILLALFALFEILALTGIAPAPHAALRTDPINRFYGAALLGTFLFFVASRPRPVEIGAAIGIAAVVRWLAIPGMEAPLADKLAAAAMGLGEGSIIVLGVKAALATKEARPAAIHALAQAAALPLFVALTITGLTLSAALHPVTYDGAAYHVDAALGGQLSFVLGRAATAAPFLRVLAAVVYVALPLAIGAVYLFAPKRGARGDLMEAVLFAGIFGFALYHACPVAGPVYLFRELFPRGSAAIAPDLVELASRAVSPYFARNGVPSLHTAWALLLFWHAGSIGKRAYAAAGVWLALTLFATLALGEHYLIDLVIGLPFAVAIDAATTPVVAPSHRARLTPLAVGAALVALWIVLLRSGVPFLEGAPPLAWALVIVTVAAPLAARRELVRLSRGDEPISVAPAEIAAPLDPKARSFARTIAILFFCSGFSGLVYEVVFEKSLALTFGNTAQASATVLATYMGGMALGAWAGGRIGARAGDALRVYAFAELGIGVICAVSPLLFQVIRAAYVALAAGLPPGHPGLVAVQIGLGGLVLLPATFLMGITMPVLARELLSARSALGSAVSVLYGANTLGAAAGAFLTGYFVLPFLGIQMTTWLAVALNLLVALVGLRLSERKKEPDAPKPEPVLSEPAAEGGSARERGIALAILLGGGAITLALEVAYTHLLAVVAGNSVYAFSLMLFSFLVGLGLGSALVRPLLRRGSIDIAAVAAIEVGLAVAILAGVWVWESIPSYFASFAGYPAATRFGERELVRFLVCCVAMVPPAIAIGALYPAALACASRGHPRGPIAAVGRASALNTAGNIVGALAGSFLLLPRLGSLGTLHALAAFALTLGGLPFILNLGELRLLLLPMSAALVLFVAQPKQFDLDRLASGANVYFHEQGYGKVVDSAESVSGGLTTIAERQARDGSTVHTLLTNGKFQGDDGLHDEMPAQFGFALCPLLHTDARSNALVIGFGAGGTSRVMRDAGFARTDIVELSADILRLANKHLPLVHDGVLSDPTVHPWVTDGRNYLLVQERRYDVISIEISSIWFAGAASLYNRDFYTLAKKRLAPGGVLQQWIQLHHLAPNDIASILATIRAELPFVRLYVVGAQGMLVACAEDCPVRPATVAALDASPRLATVREIYGGSVQGIVEGLTLDPRGVERLLGRWVEAGLPADALISTDDNMLLEYATPRGNVMPYGPSLQSNLAMLRFRRPEPPPSP